MLSTKQFSYDPETKVFSAEISELGKEPFVRICNDACDYGVIVYSHVTGLESKWAVNHEERDADNDIVAWHLIPIGDVVKICPSMRMVIFND